jgi:hypothetical protein
MQLPTITEVARATAHPQRRQRPAAFACDPAERRVTSPTRFAAAARASASAPLPALGAMAR